MNFLKRIKITLLVTLTVLSILKFFTFSYFLADDPTSGICITPNFSFSNRHLIEDSDVYFTILNSENSFIGENIYHFVVGWGWFFAAIATITIFILPYIQRFKKSIYPSPLLFFHHCDLAGNS